MMMAANTGWREDGEAMKTALASRSPNAFTTPPDLVGLARGTRRRSRKLCSRTGQTLLLLDDGSSCCWATVLPIRAQVCQLELQPKFI